MQPVLLQVIFLSLPQLLQLRRVQEVSSETVPHNFSPKKEESHE